ncbi:MAG TPA: hypothetical protein VGO95_01820 [Modestobacter sp.]|nr:hypothetical protein [Modestobacter sp.]
MGILSRLMGTAEGTAARTGRSATGGRNMKAATPRGGGLGRSMRRGNVTPPAASGGLGKLLGSLTGRR